MKKYYLFKLMTLALFFVMSGFNANAQCTESGTAAAEGTFTDGYTLTFETSGSDVVVTFALLDNRDGVVPYLWKESPFAEIGMAAVSGATKTWRATLASQTSGVVLGLGVKVAYAGGLSRTPYFNYTVGDLCSVDPADDVSLSVLTVDGTTIAGFDAKKVSYSIELAAGTTVVPTVVATAAQSGNGATAVVTPANSIPGTTTVLVTSSNTNQTSTVSIVFVVNTPGVAAPTPKARASSDVVSVYSNGYADVPVIFNPFGGSTKTLETIAGRPTIKLADLNYSHLQMNNPKLDLTGMTHIHFDAWTPNATKIRCRLESGGGSNVDFDNPVLREWKGYDILLSSYPDPSDKTALEFIIFASDQVGANDEILFLDNIYFYKGELPTPVAALSKYCATEVKHLNIPAEVNSAVNLTISNIDATSMYIELEAPSGATALSNTTIDPINGIAGVKVETSTGVFRTTFTFTNAPATIAPIIQWNNGTNWIIRIADVDGSLPFSASCQPPAPTTISASATTTADVTTGNLIIDASQIYTVATGHTLTVLGDLSGAGQLVINSGASLITSDGNTIGNVTIKRNTRYADGKYSFVGTPVEANASITGADLGSFVYSYDESVVFGADGLARWQDASATQLVPGVGYTQANKQEITFTGVPNDGTITVAGLSHTAPDANHGEHGWNILSNPYPAAIDVTRFLNNTTNKAVLNGSVYLWDDQGSDTGRGDNGDYMTVNSLGEVGGPNGGVFNGYIGSMQGFFVKVASPNANASVQFTEIMRVGGVNTDGTFFRQDEAQLLNVKLSLQSETGFYNETLIGFREDATQGIDRNYDADKLLADQDLQFYSLIGGEKFAIQGLPIENGVSTELGFDLGFDNQMTLKVEELNGLVEGMTFYLHDSKTGKVYDLSETTSFTFSAAKGADQNRFNLTYSVAGVLANALVQDQPVYRYLNNQLNVTFSGAVKVQGYSVYDLSGKVTSQLDLEGKAFDQVIIPVNNKGVTIVSIVTEAGTITRKFIF
jgi:hypothetical protein